MGILHDKRKAGGRGVLYGYDQERIQVVHGVFKSISGGRSGRKERYQVAINRSDWKKYDETYVHE